MQNLVTECPFLDLNKPDNEGITALLMAMRQGRKEVITFLSSLPNIDFTKGHDRHGGLFSNAILRQHFSIAITILESLPAEVTCSPQFRAQNPEALHILF